MYQITLTQRATDGAGVAQITLDGEAFEVVSRNGATMKLARRLIAAGYDDGPWQAVFPDGRLRLHGPSLHRLARYTVQENDRGGLRLKRYRPFAGRPSTVDQSGEVAREEKPETEVATAW